MAILDFPRTRTDEQANTDALTVCFIETLQRAHIADLDNALSRKHMTRLERAMVRQAHAMLHGDIEAADQWLIDYAGLLSGQMTSREAKLSRLVDAIAETT